MRERWLGVRGGVEGVVDRPRLRVEFEHLPTEVVRDVGFGKGDEGMVRTGRIGGAGDARNVQVSARSSRRRPRGSIR